MYQVVIGASCVPGTAAKLTPHNQWKTRPRELTDCHAGGWADRFCFQLWKISTSSPFSQKPVCRFSAGWWVRTLTSGGSFKGFGKGGQSLTSKMAPCLEPQPLCNGTSALLPHGPQVSVAPLSEGFKDHLELLSPKVIGPPSSPLRCPTLPFSCFSFPGFVHS